jgi:hypothetical protein
MEPKQDRPVAVTTASTTGWLGWAQWVVIPLLVFAASEAGARVWMSRIGHLTFLARAERAAQGGPIDDLFVGTSRVAAAVDVDAFADEAARCIGRRPRAVNMGTGYSTLVEHFFGIKTLLRDRPDALRGGVVLIEAPGGIPDAITIANRWDEPWTYEGETTRIVPHLRPGDLPDVWRSGLSFGDKLNFSFRTLTRGSALLAYRELIGMTLMDVFRGRVAGAVAPAAGHDKPAADLAERGGIRTDQEGVRRARSLAVEMAATWAADQRPIGRWGDRVVGSLVKLILEAGGRVVFFEVPLHSMQAAALTTQSRLADRRAFLAEAKTWGAVVVSPDLEAGDDDFPDVFHLSGSRSAAYSRALARAVCEAGVKPSR